MPYLNPLTRKYPVAVKVSYTINIFRRGIVIGDSKRALYKYLLIIEGFFNTF